MVEVEGLDRILRQHPFFADMSEEHRGVIVGCAANRAVHAGDYVYREGEPAETFYMIRHGRVAIEVHVPARSPTIVETLRAGDLIGWSWLVPPFRNSFDARALELTRLISLDAACLRGKMEDDYALGYQLHKRFAPVVASRLAAARRQLIDLYGHPEDREPTWR
jgi:CRP/FNR family transcriptional regulator, cyclic AMP receptor protein